MRVFSDEEIDVFQRLPSQSRETSDQRAQACRAVVKRRQACRAVVSRRQAGLIQFGLTARNAAPQQASKVSLTSFLPRLLESLHASLVCASTGHSRGQRQRGLQIQGCASSNTGRRNILVRKSHTMSSRIAIDSGSGVRTSPNPYIIIATVHAGSEVVGGASGCFAFYVPVKRHTIKGSGAKLHIACRALPSATSTSQSPTHRHSQRAV